jgi:hypothetical protein
MCPSLDSMHIDPTSRLLHPKLALNRTLRRFAVHRWTPASRAGQYLEKESQAAELCNQFSLDGFLPRGGPPFRVVDATLRSLRIST